MNLTSNHTLIVPVVRRPEYTIGLEQPNPDCTFAHCSIHVPWTGRVRRQITEDWNALTALHGGPFYALIPPHDRKLQHFARVFGFTPELVLTDLTTGTSDLIFKLDTNTDGLPLSAVTDENHLDLHALGSAG